MKGRERFEPHPQRRHPPQDPFFLVISSRLVNYRCFFICTHEYTPIELAAVFHHGFVRIHPFTEGNGRTARLLMNAILLKTGYPFIAVVPKRDLPKYLKTLMEADLGNASAFVNFVARCVERALDMYLDALEDPEILTLAEASKITPYSQEYLSLLARKGALGAFKQGRNWVITRRDLDRYLKSLARFRKKPNRLGHRKT